MELISNTFKEIVKNTYCQRIIFIFIGLGLIFSLSSEKSISDLTSNRIVFLLLIAFFVFFFYNNLKAMYTLTKRPDLEDIDFGVFVSTVVVYSLLSLFLGLIPFIVFAMYLNTPEALSKFFTENEFYVLSVLSLEKYFFNIGLSVCVALRTNEKIFTNTYKVLTIDETNNLVVIGFIIQVFNLIVSYFNKDYQTNLLFMSASFLLILVDLVYFVILVRKIQSIKL